MTDIVTRLRLDGSELSIEAADVIDLLREQLDLSERSLAVTMGSLAIGAKEPDPFSVEEVPPSTPR